jgi:outer membrane protein OmpA-like peptidoglycan-associated protein
MRWRFIRSTLLGVVGLVGVGCVHSTLPPPRELSDARAAWDRASRGPAAQVNHARLQLARQALYDAEVAYNAGDQPGTRDRAYVALRRIQTAEAEAAATLANQRRWQATREMTALQGTPGSDQRLAQEREQRLAAEARANEAMAQLSRMGNVRHDQRGTVITLSGQVLFASDQDTLLPAAEKSLDSVVAALKSIPPSGGPVVIEGHTDSRGSRAYNQDLSERRAKAVRDYLVGHGLPSDRFTIEGAGPDNPVASNRSAEGRANNRRVELVLPNQPAPAEATQANQPPAAGEQPGAGQPPAAAQPPAATPGQPTLPGQTQAPTPVQTPPAGVPPAGNSTPQMPSTPAPAEPR